MLTIRGLDGLSKVRRKTIRKTLEFLINVIDIKHEIEIVFYSQKSWRDPLWDVQVEGMFHAPLTTNSSALIELAGLRKPRQLQENLIHEMIHYEQYKDCRHIKPTFVGAPFIAVDIDYFEAELEAYTRAWELSRKIRNMHAPTDPTS